MGPHPAVAAIRLAVRRVLHDILTELNTPAGVPAATAVERFLIDELDLTRKRRAGVVDRTAAAWILQGALDRLRDAGVR